MMRFTFLLLLLTDAAYGFMVGHRPVPTGTKQAVSRQLISATATSPLEPIQEHTATDQPSQKPHIILLENKNDFQKFLEDDDRLCMVKFYAPYCKACQKFGMQYNRIGYEIGDLSVRNQDGCETIVRPGEIRLAEMEYGSNKEFCKSLGVTKLPSVHFYSNGKLVDGFPCGPRKIGSLLEKLSRFRSLTPTELAFEADMNQGMALGDSMLETLKIAISSEKAKATLPTC